ncbi:RNA methyltransferase [Chitinispirillales bacterium ANBcel5]|uniref:RNA methyltransferase n=1 Tax=Cellulosispirillum alkaliphilum TaxID=3039283 RepID=UPI002A59690A|nr:RNA methyltransferase [Chitinispirillales bacterium ANBcel5]
MGKNLQIDGFFGIGIECCKTWVNYGTLYRTARILGASFVFLINNKFKKTKSDTQKTWRSVPTYSYLDFDHFYQSLPFSCVLVGVEMSESAQYVEEFTHPERACYLLGSEDHGLSRKALDNCHKLIRLRGDHSMNVAVAGSIVLYDRFTKRTPL